MRGLLSAELGGEHRPLVLECFFTAHSVYHSFHGAVALVLWGQLQQLSVSFRIGLLLRSLLIVLVLVRI